MFKMMSFHVTTTTVMLLMIMISSNNAFMTPTIKTTPASSLYTATSSDSSSTKTTTTENRSNVKRNPNFTKLIGGYLFPEIGRRRNEYLSSNPDMKERLISLGIGDTTQPIPKHILDGLMEGVTKLGAASTYTGYGNEQGNNNLRAKIATKLYNNLIESDEVFVSDGAKCDIMRLQQIFGNDDIITAVQDPSYPVYVDTAVMIGQTGLQNTITGQYDNIIYMKCTPENNFFPNLAEYPRADIIYICSPNNPTGAVATREQLETTVALCKERGSILIFDAAYAPFINTPNIPKSIYEIDGAKDVAIEVNSFSKYAGFTGVRLGWTVVPKTLKYSDGSLVWNDYNRIMGTAFNGASNIVQNGGLACLDDDGMKEIDTLISYYLENAQLLRETFDTLPGFTVFGGIDAPYIFVKIPNTLANGKSWDAFQYILETIQVVTIPGAGFGPAGEGFLRLSAFAPRASIITACERFTQHFK